MSLILDCSEIREAIELASDLTAPLPEINLFSAPTPTTPAATSPSSPIPAAQKRQEPPEQVDPSQHAYRGDQLEQVIVNMCQRSSFSGAVITDMTGLPFAIVNAPVSMEAITAFATVLGAALERAGSLLGQHGADFLTMDINYEEKVVLYRFEVGVTPYLLLAICPQDVDERSEIEISIEQIVSILSNNS